MGSTVTVNSRLMYRKHPGDDKVKEQGKESDGRDDDGHHVPERKRGRERCAEGMRRIVDHRTEGGVSPESIENDPRVGFDIPDDVRKEAEECQHEGDEG